MPIPPSSWHDSVVLVSCIAASLGLGLLLSDRQPQQTEIEAADRVLLLSSFAYWLVYCVAFTAQKFINPEWDWLLMGVKLTGVIAYLLAATSIMSLPLHRFAARQTEY